MVKRMDVKFKQGIPPKPDLSINFSRSGLLRPLIFLGSLIIWENSEAFLGRKIVEATNDVGPLISKLLSESFIYQFMFAKIFEHILALRTHRNKLKTKKVYL